MAKIHVKKGDNVMIIAGKDKGKTGKILLVNPHDSTVIVEGAGFVVKHKKPKSAQDKGGVIKKEGKIHSSNVQIIDPTTKKPTRVGKAVIDGKKVRVGRKSGASLDVNVVSNKKAVKKAADKKAAETTPVKAETASKKQTKSTSAKTAGKPAAAKTTAATTKKTTTGTRSTKQTPQVRNQER
jgi:large subunit ribosomal protein L24